MAGTLVGFLCQDTTTTTGTGAITLANAVPSGAPAGSTTFGAFFAPGGVFQTAPGNTFYTIIDGSGNIECGLGTLTSATNLTRDYVLGAYTGGTITVATQTQSCAHVNFASGTKNVFSNASLFAASVAAWARVPAEAGSAPNAAFNAVMSGTFVGVLTNTGTVNVTIRFKITNEGMCILTIPTATVVNNAATGPVTVTGIPAFLSNVLSGTASSLGVITLNGATAAGFVTVAPGASPTATGTLTLNNLATSTTVSTTVTTNTNQGFPAGAQFAYPLF